MHLVPSRAKVDAPLLAARSGPIEYNGLEHRRAFRELRSHETLIDKTSRPSQTDDPPETARLTLEGMGPLGDTLAHFQGETVNVFGGIPGEEVLARIVRYRRRRRSYVSAVVTEVFAASPHRVEAPCGYFGACTGCQWQHIDYPHQLRLKREAVEQELRRHPALEGVSGRAHDAVPGALQLPQPRPFYGAARGDVGVRQPDHQAGLSLSLSAS